jgi:hypothetical protein
MVAQNRTGFQAVNKNFPCPVCGRTNGGCKHNHDEDFFLCITNPDTPKGTEIDGYLCVGQTKDGMWGEFIPMEDKYTSAPSAQGFAEKYVKREETKNPLTAEERHRHYSKIFSSSLPYNEATEDDIRNRDLSLEDARRMGIVSINHSWSFDVPEELPGIYKGKFSKYVEGYAIPCRDVYGNIIGFQARLPVKPADGSRYKWGSASEKTVRLQPYDELPITVYHPEGTPVAIGLAEGIGFKPYWLAKHHQTIGIGAAGRQWAGCQKQILEAIRLLKSQYGDLPVIIYPDAGWWVDPNTRGSITAIADILIEHGIAVHVADWNQTTKNQPDIDELDTEKPVRIMTYGNWKTKYAGIFGEHSKTILGFYRKTVKFTPDIITEPSEYLKYDRTWLDRSDLLAVKKSTGGGKTVGAINLYKEELKNIPDLRVLSLTYRNTLNHQTVQRVNDEGLAALHAEDLIDKVTSINYSLDDSVNWLASCPDSFRKLQSFIEQYKGKYILLIDEILKFLDHISGAGTLGSKQKECIKWLLEAIENSYKTIVVDAYLNDHTVEFLHKISGIKIVSKVFSPDVARKPRTIHFVENYNDDGSFKISNQKLPSIVLDAIRNMSKVMYVSDSQKNCETIHEIAIKAGYKNAMRIDSKTIGNPGTREALSKAREYMIENGIDFLIISPSAESGLSIDAGLEKLFDVVVMDMKGVVDINGHRQFAARNRDRETDILAAVPTFANIHSKFAKAYSKDFEKILEDNKHRFIGITCEEKNELLIKLITQSLDSSKSCPFIGYRNEINNDMLIQQQYMRELSMVMFAEAGYDVRDLVEEFNPVTKEELKATKEEVLRRYSKNVHQAPEIDFERAQKLAKSNSNKEEVQWQIKRAFLLHSLPGIEKTEIWLDAEQAEELCYQLLCKNDKFINARWGLRRLQNKTLDQSCFVLENKGLVEYGLTAMKLLKSRSVVIDAMREIGVGDLILQGEFSTKSNNKLVKRIADEYMNKNQYYNLIKITRPKKGEDNRYIAEVAKKLLGYFGLVLSKGRNNDGDRQYIIDIPEEMKPFIEVIDGCLAARQEQTIKESVEHTFKKQLAKREESETEQKKRDCQTIERFTERIREAWNYPEEIGQLCYFAPENVMVKVFQEFSTEHAGYIYECVKHYEPVTTNEEVSEPAF